jgi:hypothetical protein
MRFVPLNFDVDTQPFGRQAIDAEIRSMALRHGNDVKSLYNLSCGEAPHFGNCCQGFRLAKRAG